MRIANLVAAAMLLAFGCGSPPGGGYGGVQLCVKGATQSCVCGDGKMGAQACDGMAWEACACTPNGACTAGATQACGCNDGRAGFQSCNGGAWGACSCQNNNMGCTDGATQACACPGGAKGQQACAGGAWGTCACQAKVSVGDPCGSNSDCPAPMACVLQHGGDVSGICTINCGDWTDCTQPKVGKPFWKCCMLANASPACGPPAWNCQ